MRRSETWIGVGMDFKSSVKLMGFRYVRMSLQLEGMVVGMMIDGLCDFLA